MLTQATDNIDIEQDQSKLEARYQAKKIVKTDQASKRPSVGFGIMIMNEFDEVLVSQRLEPGKVGHLKWQFPGGHLEYAETFEQGTIREVEEEAGVVLPSERIKYMTTLNMIEEEYSYHYIGIIMFISVKKQEFPFFNNEPEKQTDWEWIAWEKLIHFRNLFTPFKHLRDQGYADINKIKSQFGLF
ncbi:probable 8-oxo-dgtp diphosphatase nudt15 [Stylonychia lemnae]|uniref:Probable 8-oxo-dgtp diphosphatase nudt15 n=1 Tax=Stylonychia lemnae TaxID=5949 RepID=A0A078B248_STYLE|nr:probable 8-oxo-dgtp diphosphatase nudt15 [Stylonychia lemnae]|eukprot:CDW87473.1 probable 8-oxo-dgtp diphosphatase nudt15 [Stylonychia lemnae]